MRTSRGTEGTSTFKFQFAQQRCQHVLKDACSVDGRNIATLLYHHSPAPPPPKINVEDVSGVRRPRLPTPNFNIEFGGRGGRNILPGVAIIRPCIVPLWGCPPHESVHGSDARARRHCRGNGRVAVDKWQWTSGSGQAQRILITAVRVLCWDSFSELRIHTPACVHSLCQFAPCAPSKTKRAKQRGHALSQP